MFKIKKVKVVRKALACFLAFFIFCLQIFPLNVYAASITIPDNLVLDQVSDSSSINSTVRNSASNDSSSLNNKNQGPKIDMAFTPSVGIKMGSKVTAIATPSYFKSGSDTSGLYFTWYLKRNNCDKTGDVNDGNKSCDLDNNGKIDENDWKIAASKIIIDGSYDSDGADYSKSVDEDVSGYKATPSPVKTKDDLNNNNVWEMNSGVDYNDSDAPNCYVQEPKSGLIYELRRVNEKLADCPDGYHRACAQDNQSAICDALNPLYDPSAAALAAANAEWNAANPTDPAYPKLPDTYDIPKNVQVSTQKFCTVAAANVSDVFCKINNALDLKNFNANVSCKNDGVPMCVKDTNMMLPATPTSTDPATAAIFAEGNLCSSLTQNPNIPHDPLWVSGSGYNFLQDPSAPKIYTNPDPIFANVIGQTCLQAKEKIIKGDISNASNINLNQNCTFEKDVNLCKHLFPKVPGEVTGDGKFSAKEKEFWDADPTKASTNGAGKDEANATGLGINKFSWTYSDGDEVGVAIEGEATVPTLHGDSSFMRMWAFSKNTCKALEDLDDTDKNPLSDGTENNIGKRGFYLEKNGATECDLADKSQCTGVLTAEVDLNDCLEENLIDPNNFNTEPELATIIGLHVDLGYFPANPINDPEGNGDILTVTADPANFKNPTGLQYEWSVMESRDGSNVPIDTTKWVDITSTMKKGGSFTESDLSGFGKNKLDATLNLQEDVVKNAFTSEGSNAYNGTFYLKVRVKATGSGEDASENILGESKPIRVTQQNASMHAYNVSATNSGIISLTPLELCYNQQTNKTLSPCLVYKNQIIGMVVNNNLKNSKQPFSWTVNGNAVECKSSISSDCTKGNVLIFPILGNEGEAVNVQAKGINENNEVVDVTRHFVIGSSPLGLFSINNNVWPKLLGYYRGVGAGGSCLQGGAGCVADVSGDVLETNNGSTVTLNAYGQSGFDWIVDGQLIIENRDNPQFSFVADKPIGDSYNIGLMTHLTPDFKAQMNNVRYALSKNWGIVADDIIDENQNVNVQINVVANANQTVAQADNKSIAASLITHLPEQLMFLFKISLTAFTMLLSAGLLFALIPEKLFKED